MDGMKSLGSWIPVALLLAAAAPVHVRSQQPAEPVRATADVPPRAQSPTVEELEEQARSLGAAAAEGILSDGELIANLRGMKLPLQHLSERREGEVSARHLARRARLAGLVASVAVPLRARGLKEDASRELAALEAMVLSKPLTGPGGERDPFTPSVRMKDHEARKDRDSPAKSLRAGLPAMEMTAFADDGRGEALAMVRVAGLGNQVVRRGDVLALPVGSMLQDLLVVSVRHDRVLLDPDDGLAPIAVR